MFRPLFGESMLATVQFQIITRFGTIKIQDMLSDLMLAAEFVG